MNDLPLITRILIGALLLAAVLAVFLARDSRRERALRSWVGKRRGARLHWPLEMDGELPIPFRELADLTLGRPPLGWAAAVEIERAEDQIWFLECRTTPAGRETADWFTLMARGPREGWGDPALWSCQLIDEVLTVEMLTNELAVRPDGSSPGSLAPDPAQNDEGVAREKE